MNLSWPHRAAGKAARRGTARVWVVGVTAVAVAGATALAAPGAFASAKAARAKAATTTTMSAASGRAGSEIKLVAKVTGSSPAGTVKFTYDGKTLCSASLSKGSAACSHVFGSFGSFHVGAVYEGNATHKSSQGLAWVKVLALPTSAKVTASADPTAGSPVTLTAVVAPSAATGWVTFSDAGGQLAPRVKVSGGKASLKYTWADGGTYTVTAGYSGDPAHAPSSGTIKVSVAYTTNTVITIQAPDDPYSPTLNWETAGSVEVPFTVTNNAPGGPAPTGSVTIGDPVSTDQPNPPQPPAFTGCAGKLTPVPGTNYSTGECPVTTEGWGFVLMQATYTPNSATFAQSQTNVNTAYKIINLMPTATSIAPATATANEQVTLVASVLPAAPALPPYDLRKGFSEQIEDGPPGDVGDTVTILVNDVAACTETIAWNATAQADQVDCAVTLAAGTYTVEADFSGDEYAAASTGTETLTVS